MTVLAASSSKYAVAGILTIAAGVIAAVFLLVLVPAGDFRNDYLLVGSIAVAIAIVAGAVLLLSSRLPEARRGPVLSSVALVAAIGGWVMVIVAFVVAVRYEVSGGPLTIDPLWWWLLPLGAALVAVSGPLGIVGLARRWPVVPSLLALILAALPVALAILSFILFSLPIFGTSPQQY